MVVVIAKFETPGVEPASSQNSKSQNFSQILTSTKMNRKPNKTVKMNACNVFNELVLVTQIDAQTICALFTSLMFTLKTSWYVKAKKKRNTKSKR